MKTIFIFLTAIIFSLNNTVAQWSRINAIPTQNIVALATFGDTILAASGRSLIYKSVDSGTSWDSLSISSNQDTIMSLKIIDNKIYVGTSTNGIFCSEDNGLTWPNTGINLLDVSGFEKFGSDVYAISLGDGVYVFNQALNNWIPFNDSLPSYSVNVFTITGTTNSLLIGPGANGTFYRYDFNVNGWNEEYYDGILHPGLKIDKLISNSDTIFAVNGNRIIRSEDDGLSWMNDITDTHNGVYRNIYSGISKHYTITNLFPEGTWVQERDKGSVTGTTWATNEELIPTGFSYDILEFHDKLFLGKADGLYTKSIVQGINNPVINISEVKIYPNPSNNSLINISSGNQIDKLTIISPLGSVLFSENINKYDFTIEPHLSQGVYFINLTLTNNQNITKRIIIE